MAQSISGDITLEDERGNVVESQDIHIGEVIELIENNLSEGELEKTFCLQFVDPYGNTTFNSPQTTILIEEFKSLLDNCKLEEKRKKIKTIIEFISKAQNEVHTYIKFHGD